MIRDNLGLRPAVRYRDGVEAIKYCAILVTSGIMYLYWFTIPGNSVNIVLTLFGNVFKQLPVRFNDDVHSTVMCLNSILVVSFYSGRNLRS